MQHMDESELSVNHSSKLLNSSRSLYKDKRKLSENKKFLSDCYFPNIQYRVIKTNILDVN